MIFSLLMSVLTIFVLIGLIVYLDNLLEPYWGSNYSLLKAVLFFLALLSSLYQIALIFHLPWLISVVDYIALATCLFSWKSIFSRLKFYVFRIFILPWQNNERHFYILYAFLFYLFLLSLFAVQGWEWDTMVYHLPRSFIYLNEGTIFTNHFTDGEQVHYPMGTDALQFIFVRYGETFGTGFFQFLFYVASLMAVYHVLISATDRKTSMTMVFIAASLPLLVYSASSAKNDLPMVFAYLMMWLSYLEFRKSRNYIDLYAILLACAFGLTAKGTFIFHAPITLIAFFLLDYFDTSPRKKFVGRPLNLIGLVLFSLMLALLSQVHLYIYNLATYGHLAGSLGVTFFSGNYTNLLAPFQNFIKHHLHFVDFILPLSWKGIPFVDTFLSSLYNHSIGKWTGDGAFHMQYKPQELMASFGLFGFTLIVPGVYLSLFRRENRVAFVFACVWIAAAFVWCAAFSNSSLSLSGRQYYMPIMAASLFLLPSIYSSKLVSHHRIVRLVCMATLTFCCIFNYGKPLLAYDQKVIPWWRYSFTDRDFLYKNKHFADNRINVYRGLLRERDRILIIGTMHEWVYPYYQYARKTSSLISLRHTGIPGDEEWATTNINDYDLIICAQWMDWSCKQKMDSSKELQRVWVSSLHHVHRAAFYRRRVK